MKTKFKHIIPLFLIFSIYSFGQKDSKGDYYFFEYAYKNAIQEYTKEAIKKSLTPQQSLNLADSYLKTGAYKKAAEIYTNSYEKDSTLSSTYFNKMLQSISRIDSIDKVKAYLENSKNYLSREQLENAEFNFELLEKNQNGHLDFYVFNCYLNSPQADFSPAFYKDQILFTSGRPKGKREIYEPSGEAYLDIYSGIIQPDGDVTVPKSFNKIPNSSFHKATPFYSEKLDDIIYMLSNADGDDLLFDSNGKNTLAIGKVNDKGRFEYLLRDLSTSFYYPFYEEATGKLYFSANFSGGYGGTDIYYVYTNSGQIMSAPVNLGPRINSPGNEIAPFIFQGSLYFSSDIFYGIGGMDIYTSNIESDDSFSIPINLGEGINSSYDDFGFIIKNDANGFSGYFSSNREGGKGKDDIYGYKVSEKPGLKTIAIKGTVANSASRKNIENAKIVLLDENEEVLKETSTDENGNFQFEIPYRKSYAIKASKKGHGIFFKTFGNEDEAALSKKKLTIELPFIQDVVEEKEGKTVLKIRKFYFNAGSSQLTPDIKSVLDNVVAIVGNFPEIKLKIESHTSSRGSDTKNLELSTNRAKAIQRYLMEQGVSQDNIDEAIGYGESMLVNQCKNGVFCLEFLHNQNDRSLISVLNYDALN